MTNGVVMHCFRLNQFINNAKFCVLNILYKSPFENIFSDNIFNKYCLIICISEYLEISLLSLWTYVSLCEHDVKNWLQLHVPARILSENIVVENVFISINQSISLAIGKNIFSEYMFISLCKPENNWLATK